jgi:sulfite reductase (NADPH) flavoprotein alpha-component
MLSQAFPPAVLRLLPDDAPFSREQRMWLNGFFAGLLTQLAAKAHTQAPAAAERLAVQVLFASQTGTAEGLAKKLTKEAKSKGFDSNLQDLGALSLASLARLKHVLVIASTHGEGDPPDAVGAFVMQLDMAQGTPLAGLKYAVLALGDSSYAKFCHFGKMLDDRFATLGATRLVERVDADADVAHPFGTFRDRLWPALQAEAPGGALVTQVPQAVEDPEEPENRWTRYRPFAATLRGKAVLNGAGSDKEVRHVVLSLQDSGLKYEPGDALGVWPRQSRKLVDAVLALTGSHDTTPVAIDEETHELGGVLATRKELAKLTAPTVIKFSALTDCAELRALVRPEQSVALERYLYGKDIIDLLQRYPGVVSDAQTLVNLLPPLAPRLYSISSSLAAFPDEVHLTVTAVRYECGGRHREGVASTWFADRTESGAQAPVYVNRNLRFRLPKDPGTPIVMIGPGTGIAPFRAFLHHRRVLGLAGRTWLFFGDRHAHCDFLYRSELESFLKGRELWRLDTAFSRDQPQKIYVQQRMLEAGKELWSWLQEGAVIYVCGDASRMAKDVDAALQSIIAVHGRRSAAQARLEVHELAAAGRYVRDVY